MVKIHAVGIVFRGHRFSQIVDALSVSACDFGCEPVVNRDYIGKHLLLFLGASFSENLGGRKACGSEQYKLTQCLRYFANVKAETDRAYGMAGITCRIWCSGIKSDVFREKVRPFFADRRIIMVASEQIVDCGTQAMFKKFQRIPDTALLEIVAQHRLEI